MFTLKVKWLLIATLMNVYFVNAQNWKSNGVIFNSSIHSLCSDTINNIIFAGGQFFKVNNIPTYGFCGWKNDSILSYNNSVINGTVNSIINYNNEIIIGGTFNNIDNNYQCSYIAKWNGINWVPMSDGFNNAVWNLRVIDNELYAVGGFDSSGTIEANGLAKWNGINWENVHNLPTFDPFTNNPNMIFDICKYNNELYVGGNFNTNDLSLRDIVKYDGNNWIVVGGGLHGSYSDVNKMLVYNGKLVVAGMFYKQNGNVGNFIMTYDGQQWEELGGGTWGIYGNLGTLGTIYDMLIYKGKLYISGLFNYAGSTPASHVAVWDGQKWCGYPGVFDNTVNAMTIFKDTIYIASGLTIDGDTVNWFAKYSGGLTPDTCGFVGIQENNLSTEKINIYPNPANTSFEITTDNEQFIQEIKLYSIEGKLLKQQSYSENKVKINTSAFPTGMYLIKVQTKEKRMFQKLIISH